ncbi:MAG TPA: lysophospholipid acyltransferase family protein [Candidatus Binatia bacterium]|nr:lysophospholipid acyltransferase family protein [Candidatus Binatia bacterium]
MEPARHLRAAARGKRASGRLKVVGREPLASARRSEGLVDDAFDLLLGALALVAPGPVRDLEDEMAAKLARIPTELNEYGYDAWGFGPDTSRRVLTLLALFYRYYFRVEMHGIENFPSGRMLLIANHSGQLPFDAAMLMVGSILEGEPPRMLRGMAEYWMTTLPYVSTIGARIGSVVGTPKNCIDLLRRDEAVIAFPEGVRGLNKPFSKRYRLQRFGLGFMRLALASDAPIVPAVVVGAEEQLPAIANLEAVGRLVGAPALPIPALLPILGPLALFPLPVKYHVWVGEPLHFTGNPNDEDVVIGALVERVRSEMRSMIERGLRERRSPFF